MKQFSNTLVLPLLTLLFTLVAAIAMAKVTGDRAEAARRLLDTQLTQMRDAQTRVQKSGSEKELIVRYLPDYQKLDAIGFVGDEQRIKWLDALRNANQKGGMFGVSYDISARKPYPHTAALGAGAINVMHSVMKLRFQMLHEQDLLNLFAYLSEQNVGVFLVNSCALRRTSATPAARFQPNMLAECELSWITARPPPTVEMQR